MGRDWVCRFGLFQVYELRPELFLTVMRKEAVHTLLLNAILFKGMKCSLAQDPRYLRFSVFENGAATHYNLRVSRLTLVTISLASDDTYLPQPPLLRFLTRRSQKSC